MSFLYNITFHRNSKNMTSKSKIVRFPKINTFTNIFHKDINLLISVFYNKNYKKLTIFLYVLTQ